MARSFWALLLVAVPAAAQEPEVPTRKVTVTPAAAPDRALRYRLLPELRDTTPGNAAVLYYRAFSPEWLQSVRGDRKQQEAIEEATQKSPAEVKSIAALAIIRNSAMLKEVDRAARRAYCDWELTPRVREDGVALLIPDVQAMRENARYLAIRAKLELADGQFDRAARTLQTGLQMGRHVADAPTLIQALVGAAVTAVMLNEVEDWVKTPGSPNLYWALSDLPQPYVPLRKPYQGERLFIDNLLPGFREAVADPNSRPMSADQLRSLTTTLGQLSSGPAVPPWAMVGFVAKKYGAAKEYLKARGWTEAQVEVLPAMQVVFMREVAEYDRHYDEMIKWAGQPHWVARAGLARAVRQFEDEMGRSGTPNLSLAGLLLPAITKVQFVSARTDRTINLLRTVEALRLYAAAHGGWPEALADVTDVPVPNDPVTGKPFEYRRDGDAAVLTAPPPAGERPGESNSRRYEIRLAK